MARKPRLQRIVFDVEELDMPMISGLGCDHLLEPIGLKAHAHDCPELTFVAEGEVCWVVGRDDKLNLTGGTTAVIQPRTVHKGEWEIITPSVLFWIVFDPSHREAAKNTTFTDGCTDKITTVFRHCGNTVRNADATLKRLYTQLREALSAHDRKDPLSLSWIRSIVCQIIIVSARIFQEPHNRTINDRASDLTRVFAFMKQHLHDNLSVHDFADFSGISVARFNDFFKRETGLTPADYFRRLKCNRARYYLAESSKSITEIAFQLGFSSSQHFASVFRKYSGMSPGEYRNHNSQNRP